MTVHAHAHGTSPRGLLATLLALLVLAAVSFAFRFAHLGSFSYPVALGIAALKAGLVVTFFMEIMAEKAAVRFAFGAGFALIALLLTLMVADILTRAAAPRASPADLSQAGPVTHRE